MQPCTRRCSQHACNQHMHAFVFACACTPPRPLAAPAQVDPDAPWFCCLHPNPDLASCLAPEEPHDGDQQAQHDAMRYATCAGFRPDDGSPDGAGAAEPDAANVAHFAAVLASLPDTAESQRLREALLWLAERPPRALKEQGVAVPRWLQLEAPEYGERCAAGLLGLLLSLGCISAAVRACRVQLQLQLQAAPALACVQASTGTLQHHPSATPIMLLLLLRLRLRLRLLLSLC